jgi:hypothetical protein
MLQAYPGFAFVAFFTIVIMLLLCIDVIKRSYQILQANKPEPKTEVEEHSIPYEKHLVYPFYIDCSRSIDKLPSPYDSPTMNSF